MLTTLINVIRNSFLPEARISLGRWNTSYATSSINSKVDLANEDHCGPCGQYILEKNNKKKIDFNYPKLRKQRKMTDFINDYKKFLIDIKSIEKDSLKIKSTINQVSENESIRDILEVLNNIIDIEEKIKNSNNIK